VTHPTIEYINPWEAPACWRKD